MYKFNEDNNNDFFNRVTKLEKMVDELTQRLNKIEKVEASKGSSKPKSKEQKFKEIDESDMTIQEKIAEKHKVRYQK